MKKPLTTPSAAFAATPDYPYKEHFHQVEHPDYGKLNMHYVDEGPREGPVVLLAHGEPSWSFCYRHVIAQIAKAGFRVIAPDHIGFGKSDKLIDKADYSYQHFVDWMTSFIQHLDLKDIVLFCQDWGGPINLRVASQMPKRYRAIITGNTLLPNSQPPPLGVDDWPGEIIKQWVETVRQMTDMPIGDIVKGVSVNCPNDEVIEAYNAPFPDASYKAAALVFPLLIPTNDSMLGTAENRIAWKKLEQFEQPFITAFSDSDPSTKAWEAVFQQRIKGAQSALAQSLHTEIAQAGHFVQEEQPQAVSELILKVLQHSETKDGYN